jgi:tRNA(Ile)-lysidine synthase
MAQLAPFEKNPTIAVGVSGGADSMALLHLAAEWAQAQNGSVIAFTVDHAIREASAEEAKQVGKWAAKRQVPHVVLKWQEPDALAASLQQRARAARHALLEQAARERGILHLLIAHHEDDQAETVLLRLSKGSGPDGMAAMAAVTHKQHIRLLRPLLHFPRTRLIETCRERGQAWIDDPSNVSPRFARPRLRAVGDALAAEGLTAHNLALTALASGKTRAALERATADLLGRQASLFPQGYAEVRLKGWDAADSEVQRRALSLLVQVIGGGDYQLDAPALDDKGKTTLGNCLIDRTADKILIIREERNIQISQVLEPFKFIQWDRFEVWSSHPLSIGALGKHVPENASDLPQAILATQPAFRRDGQVVAVPTIGYYAEPDLKYACKARFSPGNAAGDASFAIV